MKGAGANEIQDIVAQTFLAFTEKDTADTLNFRYLGGLYNYLRTTLQYKIADHYRIDERRPSTPMELGAFEGMVQKEPSPEEAVADKLMFEGVVKALVARGRLDERGRSILFELLFPGQTRKELAEEPGISPGNFRLQVHRARRKLQNILPELLEVGFRDGTSASPSTSKPANKTEVKA